MPRPSRPPTAARISTLVGAAVGIAGALFVVSRIGGEWSEAREALREARWGWLVPAFLLAACGMTWVGMSWRACLHALGCDTARLRVLVWYFIGQLGKYVPGGVWPMVGRGEMATRDGVPRPVAYNSVALSMALTYLAAAVVVVALLPFDLSGTQGGGTRWLFALVPVGLLVLHPRVLGRLLRVAERILGDGEHPQIPSWGVSMRLIGRHLPAWIAIGVSTWMVARAFDPGAPFVQVAAAGVFSWIVGFVAVPVPGGIGVREAAFVAVAGSLTSPVAATTAVVSRLVFMLVDALGAAMAVGPLRAAVRRRGTVPPSVSGSRASAPAGPRGDGR